MRQRSIVMVSCEKISVKCLITLLWTIQHWNQNGDGDADGGADGCDVNDDDGDVI